MMFGGNGGIVWAERTIPSGMAGLAIATVPLWMAAIDRVVLGHRQPRVVVIGLAVGFIGAALLVGGNALEGEIDMGGLVLALAAAASWAVGSIYQRHAALPHRPLVAAGMEMLVAAGLFFVVGGLVGEFGISTGIDLTGIMDRARLPGGGRVVDRLHVLPVAAAQRRTSLVATYAYVTPIGAVIVGALILDEIHGEHAARRRPHRGGGSPDRVGRERRARDLRRRSTRVGRRTRAQPRGRSRPVAGWVRPGPAP